MRIKVTLLLLVALLLASFPVFAQESTLTEEEQATLDRALASLQAELDIEREIYTAETDVTNTQNLVFYLGEETEQRTETVSTLQTVNVIKDGEDRNVGATFTINYSALTGTDEANAVEYTMSGEIRYVDGALYVTAAYDSSTGEVPTLPEGWVLVDDPANFPELEVIDLENFIDDYVNEDDEDEIADRQALIDGLGQYATSVELTQAEINGTAVDVVFITLTTEGFAALQANNPNSAALFAVFPQDEETAQFALALETDTDQLRGLAINFSGTATAVPLNVLVPTAPEGSTADLVVELTNTDTLLDANPTLTPVEAPEVE